MNSIQKFLLSIPRWVVLTTRAMAISAATIFAAWLSGYFGNQTDDSILVWVIRFAGWLVLIAVVVSISYIVVFYTEQAQRAAQKRRDVKAFAYERIDRWLSDCLESERELPLVCAKAFDEGAAISSLRRSNQVLIDGMYEVLEAHFAREQGSEDRIDFEVTLMTKSFIDGGITIAGWASRAHRQPLSLSSRQDNPHLYEGTETHKLYQLPRPILMVVEDTGTHDYKEVYDNQKAHIRSSIIVPCLDERNQLVGTVVCHCNRASFFKRSESRFWSELVEIFGRRIALNLARIENLVANSNPTQQPY